MIKRTITLAAAALLAVLLLAGCAPKGVLDKNDPVTITVWHYYNGAQQTVFDELVREFNETAGAEKGIVVEAQNQGDVNGLADMVLQAATGVAGAQKMPDVFAAYSDTAFEINKMGLAAELDQYMTEQELAAYIPSFLDEGRFEEDGGVKLFPIAKSTEVFVLNATDWQTFADETGASTDSFSTWEGIARTARQYYEWTDAQTPEPDDGKAFFGRDAYANYFIIGSLQLGTELFKVESGEVTFQIDREVMRRLWDNLYVPYINGWYGSYGKFRSDDARTGAIIAFVGSSSGASYFPSEVTREDGTSYPVETQVYPLPNFEGTQPYAVQQGAGMVVVKSDEKHETASIEFLKWFTEAENNIRFSVSSGYLPVKSEANDEAQFEAVFALPQMQVSEVTRQTLLTGSRMTRDYTLYTSRAFESGYAARRVVEYSMMDLVAQDLEQIDALMDEGMTRAEAVAQFTTDAHFEQWLASLTDALESAK